MITPTTIAAAMQRQAESAGVATRQLPGGLRLRLRLRENVWTLDLMRRGAYPDADERDGWRKAFGVPSGAWEYHGPFEELFLISFEYYRRLL